MADQFTGQLVVVEFNTVDISGTAKTVEITESADEPEEIDKTHKGDTERLTIEGVPGSTATTVTMNLLDEVGGVAALLDFAVNSKDTLVIYPEGKVHTKEMITVQNARLIEIAETIPYDNVVELNANWNAKNTVSRGTYSTAA